MTDEQRLEMIEEQLDLMYAVCNSFAEVGEEDNCRAIYEEYAEWIEAENTEGEGEYVTMWAPNFITEA